MKFSIIVPVYNVEKYLCECLDSVLAQTFGDFECICVDDGSTDGSGRILDQYAERDERMVAVHQANGGEGAARNAGLELARGDWLAFVDSDDVVSPHALSDFAEALGRYEEVDLVRYGTSVYQDGAAPVWGGNGDLRLIDISHCIPDEFSMYGVTEMAYRRSMFGDVRFRSYKIGADIVFTSACFARAKRLVSIDRSGYGYRIRTGSMAHSVITPDRVMARIDFIREQFANFCASGKHLERGVAHARANMWIEQCAAEISSLADMGSDVGELLKHWTDSLKDALSMPYLTSWQRGVARAVLATHNRLLVRLLCALPYNLKLKGHFRR